MEKTTDKAEQNPSKRTQTPKVDVAVDRKSYAIEMLEKEYKGKVISIQDAEDKGYGELIKWLKRISRYGNIERTMIFLHYSKENGGERINVKFFTAEHVYGISARLPNANDYGYLGCISSCRKPKVGETWTRGSDLSDGKYSEDTFIKIMSDIVSYEMKNLQCF